MRGGIFEDSGAFFVNLPIKLENSNVWDDCIQSTRCRQQGSWAVVFSVNYSKESAACQAACGAYSKLTSISTVGVVDQNQRENSSEAHPNFKGTCFCDSSGYGETKSTANWWVYFLAAVGLLGLVILIIILVPK